MYPSPTGWICVKFDIGNFFMKICQENPNLVKIRHTYWALYMERERGGLNYPACNAHASYCHVWPVQLYSIFWHCLIKGTTFGKKVFEHEMCVLIFSVTSVWKISHSKKNWVRYDKCILTFMLSTHHSCQILMKFEFSCQIFEKFSNTVKPALNRSFIKRNLS